MKRIAVFLVCLLVAPLLSFGQEQSLSPKVTVKGDNIEITYGQPSKRNRVIFGQLVPYGEVWRAGANEATEVTFKKDGTFGGKPVKAGTYTLFAIPKEKEWDIILNGVLNQWGAYEYEKIKAKNISVITVPATKLDNVKEKLTYSLSDHHLKIEWDQVGVAIPLSFK
jgi:hypothetical protein